MVVCKGNRRLLSTPHPPHLLLCSLLGLLLAPLCIERFGWPSVFYLFGGMGLVWCLWWEKLVAEVRGTCCGSDAPTG